MPTQIKSALEGRDKKRALEQGIIETAFSPHQREILKEVLPSGLTEKRKTEAVKAPEPKTPLSIGVVQFPGSKFH